MLGLHVANHQKATRTKAAGLQARWLGLVAVALSMLLGAQPLRAQTVNTPNILLHQAVGDLVRRNAQNDLVRQAAYALTAESQDLDGDGVAEPPAMLTGAGGPTGGGRIPVSSLAAKTDGFGGTFGYCAFDGGSVTGSANRINGSTNLASPILAVVSPGLDGSFQSTCANILSTGAASGDDVVVTVSASQASQGVNSNLYWGSPVADTTALNALATASLREGEVRLVRATNQMMRWNSTTSTWVSVSGEWTRNGNNIHYNAGNVGIGTSTPNALLQFGNAVSATPSTMNMIRFYEDTAIGHQYGIGISASQQNYRAHNHVFFANAGTPVEALRITTTGQVGIGTATPSEKLHIEGGSIYTNGENTGVVIDASGNKRAGLIKYAGHEMNVARVAGQDFGIVRTAGSNLFDGVGMTYDLYVDGTGRVGIGTTTPTSTLHVQGSAAGEGLVVTAPGKTTAVALNVSASDFGYLGLGGAGNSATTLRGNGYASQFGGPLGIGMAPTAKLDIMQAGSGWLDGIRMSTVGSANTYTILNDSAGAFLSLAANADYNKSMVLRGDTGFVGVGTVNPAYKLDVNGTLGVTGAANFANNVVVAGDMSVGSQRLMSVTRTVPTNIGEAVDVGSFNITHTGGTLEFNVVVSENNFSVAKSYVIPVNHAMTAGAWTEVAALSSSGNYAGNDFALDANVGNWIATFRLRRTGGASPGTFRVVMRHSGRTDMTFTPSTAVAAVSAPSSLLPSTALTQLAGRVGIGTANPVDALDLGSGTHGRSIVWGGPTGLNQYASIGTSYSNSALNMLSGLRLSKTADAYEHSYTGNFGAAGVRMEGTSGDIRVFTAPMTGRTAGAAFDPVASTRMLIKSTGNVLIGTSTDNGVDMLQVNGTISAAGFNIPSQGMQQPISLRGTGLNNSAANHVIIGNTVVTSNTNRGLTLVVINKSNHSVVSTASYDTFGSAAAATSLGTALNAMTNQQIGVLVSWDAWTGWADPTLRAAALRRGLFKLAALADSSAYYRSPYAAIFDGATSTALATARANECAMNLDPTAPYCDMRGWLSNGGFSIAGDTLPNALALPDGSGAGVFVGPTGRVGIGTTNPGNASAFSRKDIQLHVMGAGNTIGMSSEATGAGAVANIALTTPVGGTWLWQSDDTAAAPGSLQLWREAGSSGGVTGDVLTMTPAGLMGLGTAAPTRKLDIIGDVRIVGTDPTSMPNGWHRAISFGSTAHAAMMLETNQLLYGMHSDNRFYWARGSAYSMTLDTNTGNLGVGTNVTTPAAKLHVASINDAILIRPNGMLGGEVARLKFQDPDAGTAAVSLEYVDDGTAALGVMGGNFGVGTNNPLSTFDTFNAAGSAVRISSNSAATYGELIFSSNNSAYANYGASIEGTGEGVGVDVGALLFKTGYAAVRTERMRINGAGNVGIGVAAPASKLHVLGDVRSGAAGLQGGLVLTGSNGNTFVLRPSNTTNNLAFTLPAADGAANECLKTNGAGTLTFAACGVGASVGGTGSAGQVAFWSTTSAVAGSSNLYWNNSLNRLGIGTNAPSMGIDLVRNIGTGGYDGIQIHNLYNSTSTPGTTGIDFTFDNSYWLGSWAYTPARIQVNPGNYYGGNSALQFHVADTSRVLQERMRIDAQGDVGIGTTNPVAKLHVLAGLTEALRLDYNGSAYTGFQLASSGGLTVTSTGALILNTTLNSATGMQFQRNGATLFNFDMTNGRLGIGTTAPSMGLDLVRNIGTGGADGIQIHNVYNSTSTPGLSRIDFTFDNSYSPGSWAYTPARIQVNPGTYYGSGSTMTFNVADSARTLQERMRIDVAGNVGISALNPLAKLHILAGATEALRLDYNGTGNNTAFQLASNGGLTMTSTGPITNTANGQIVLNTSLSSATAIQLQRGGAALFNFDMANTRLGIGTTAPTRGIDLVRNIAGGGFDGIVIHNIYNSTATPGTAGLDFTFDNAYSPGSWAYTPARLVVNPGNYYGGNTAFAINVADASRVLQERMRIDAAGDVGIGTANPVAKLHVMAGTTEAMRLDYNGTYYSNFQVAGNGSLTIGSTGTLLLNSALSSTTGVQIQRNGTTLFDFDLANTRLGIGTTAPSLGLDLVRNIATGGSDGIQIHNVYNSTSTPGTAKIDFTFDNSYSPGSWAYTPGRILVNPGNYYGGNSSMTFSVADSGRALQERMRIDAVGDVGIGTANPVAKLHLLAGTTEALRLDYNGTYFSKFDLGSTGGLTTTSTGPIAQSATGGYTVTATGQLVFNTSLSSTTGMQVQRGGTTLFNFDTANTRLGIGTASPSMGLDLVRNIGTGGWDGIQIHNVYNSTSTPGTAGIDFTFDNSYSLGSWAYTPARIQVNPGNYYGGDTSMVFSVANTSRTLTERMRINSSGFVGIGTNAPDHTLHVAGDIRINTAEMLRFGGSMESSDDVYFIRNQLGSNLTELQLILGDDALNGSLYKDSFRISTSNGYDYFKIDTADGVYFPTGNVGIGTTTPAYKLDVVGTMRVSGDMTFSGNVGIGTTTPAAKLHVLSGATEALRLGYSAAAYTSFNIGSAGGLTMASTGPVALSSTGAMGLTSTGAMALTSTGAMSFDTGTSSATAIQFRRNGTTLFNFDTANTRLGIGTASPSMGLDLARSIGTGGYDGVRIHNLYNSTSTPGTAGIDFTFDNSYSLGSWAYTPARIQVNPGNYYGGDTSMVFSVANTSRTLTERMRINSSGFVGIGTSAPDHMLHVAGDIRINTAEMLRFGGSMENSDDIYFIRNQLGANATELQLILGDDGLAGSTISEVFRVSTSNGYDLFKIDTNSGVFFPTGNVGIGTTTPSYKLDVVGTLRASGDATFSSNVGIGTASPTARLHVITTATEAMRLGYNTSAFTSFNIASNGGLTMASTGPVAMSSTGAMGLTSSGAFTVTSTGAIVLDTATSSTTAIQMRRSGTTLFNFDTANARLGINTSAPTVGLDMVRNVGTGGYDGIRIQNVYNSTSTPGSVGIDFAFDNSYSPGSWAYTPGRIQVSPGNYYGGDSSMVFSVANTSRVLTERIRINALGNVGIGTSAPNAPLQFANTVQNRKVVLWEGNNNDHQFYGFGINSSVLRYQVDSTNSSHVFYAGSNTTTSNELMRITGTGNVGIGTSAPTSPLTVAGALEFFASGAADDGSDPYKFEKISAGANSHSLRLSINDDPNEAFQIWGDACAAGDCYGPGLARFHFQANGRFGIGTTSPSQAMHVVGNGLFTGSVTASSFVTSSDQRIKQVVGTLQSRGSVLAKLALIDPVLFRYLPGYESAATNLAGQEQLGVLAQQIGLAFPWLVHQIDDPSCANNPACHREGIYGVNYAGLSTVALAAVKEQQQIISQHAKVIDQFEQRQAGWAWKGTFTADRIEAQSAKLVMLEAEQAKIREIEAQKIKAQQVSSEKLQSGELEVFVPFGAAVNLYAAVPGAQYVVNAACDDGSYVSATVMNTAAGLRVVPLASQGLDIIANGQSVAIVGPNKKVKASWLRTT